MARYIQHDSQQQNTGSIKSSTETKFMAAEIKSKVTIPMYFYRIIVPQLGNYFDNYPVHFDADPRACCPLHDEDTPSFRYYEATNSFYCFGCQKGGDVIQLHRYFAEKMNGTMPDRDTAIAFVYNYFIKENESENFIDVSKQQIQEEKLNSDIDIVKLNLYRFNLEQSITFDSSLKLSVKKAMWQVLDDIDVLISKDLIKASEAEQYIKDKVKEIITFNADIKKIMPKN